MFLSANPAIHVSTGFVYTNLVLDENTPHPDIDRMITCMKKKDLKTLCQNLGNVLETVTIPAHRGDCKDQRNYDAGGALGSLMSGSGPTVFGIFDDLDKAKAAKAVCRKLPFKCFAFVTALLPVKQKPLMERNFSSISFRGLSYLFLFLQVKYSFLDLLCSSLIPELCSDVTAGTSCYITEYSDRGFRSSDIPTPAFHPRRHDLDLSVISAFLTVITLGIQFRIHDIIINKTALPARTASECCPAYSALPHN